MHVRKAYGVRFKQNFAINDNPIGQGIMHKRPLNGPRPLGLASRFLDWHAYLVRKPTAERSGQLNIDVVTREEKS